LTVRLSEFNDPFDFIRRVFFLSFSIYHYPFDIPSLLCSDGDKLKRKFNQEFIMATAKTGDTVKVHYTGKLDNGDVFDSSANADPLQFTIGAKQMIPAFEEAMIDMAVGEKKTIEIPADGAYGQRSDKMMQTVERGMLPDDIELKVGLQLTAQDPEGQPFVVTVAKFDDENVTLDGNHPLAGEDLTFDVELVEIV
jgi:FKBP-type peptidyl-prolyl cis-trans isomerase 2